MGRPEKKLSFGKKQIGIFLQGGLIAVAGSILLIFLCAFTISKGWFQLDAALKLAVASCAIGGFFSALFTVRRIGFRSLPVGLLVGSVQFLLFLLLGLLTTERMAPGMDQLPLLAACLCSGSLAGLLSKKRSRRRRV